MYIFRVIKYRWLRWVGHAAIKEEGRSTSKILTCKPTGKRHLGRPRHTWEDNIRMDLEEIGINKRNYKLRERKVKTLTRNWRDHQRTGTHKHTETVSRYFDRHGRLSQSEQSKCLWTHNKDGVTGEFTKGATRGMRLIRLRIGIIGEPFRNQYWILGFHMPWSLLYVVRRSI